MKAFNIHAVLFDFDGTLTNPGAIDFAEIRKKLGYPSDYAILEFIDTLSSSEQRRQAMSILEQFETDAAEASYPNKGAEKLLHWLKAQSIPFGILTRNSLRSVEQALKNFKTVGKDDFSVIITRDDPIPPKPSPDGVLLAASKIGVAPADLLMVGDYIFDIQAGAAAGALTALINPSESSHSLPWNQDGIESDFQITRLDELKKIVRLGYPLTGGKLSNDLLEDFLESFHTDDPAVLIHPRVGEDTAAVDIAGEEVLVLKADPITFATDSVGMYAVLVNANDVVTSGGVPRWFLTTLLFPIGTTASAIGALMSDLNRICHDNSITLCGGHTEITEAVNRPVITGMMVGTVTKNRLLDKRNIIPGDKILLTKAAAVEGTAIIAREFGDRLQLMGLSPDVIEECRRFLDDISIIPEAKIAAASPGVVAMHDVTEGGVATAVRELGIAADGRGLRIDMDAVPIFPQTREICRLLDINPLGLIGSGSLLICCKPAYEKQLCEAITQAGIAVACIGEVTESASGVEAVSAEGDVTWPSFAVDEITRLFG
ncbi:HAD-IA family hydrolase [Desulfococcaceae bacterium HSG9]|nr:HAD-IA family hydrolase [Desulfococcaceae bacterium HSG9]